eukprot:m.126514 g.126514  ORF g.126514 m.126514 type:complete len:396 (+) comp9707_c0_seq4:4276-5463(+)
MTNPLWSKVQGHGKNRATTGERTRACGSMSGRAVSGRVDQVQQAASGHWRRDRPAAWQSWRGATRACGQTRPPARPAVQKGRSRQQCAALPRLVPPLQRSQRGRQRRPLRQMVCAQTPFLPFCIPPLLLLFLRNTTAMAAAAPKFYFQRIDGGSATLSAKETRELLAKWSLAETLKCERFRFDQTLHEYESDQFLRELFADPTVQATLKVLASASGTWAPLQGEVASVQHQRVPATATSMEFFDRLYECGALRANGQIVGCIPEYDGPLTFNQELQKVLLMQDSDHYDVFSADERNQLLFRLFTLLVYGGPLNQYEDSIGPYFDLTKGLYKDVISVAKDPSSGSVYVTSLAFSIQQVDGLPKLFPQDDHPQNMMFVVVDPNKRVATVLYNAWVGD